MKRGLHDESIAHRKLLKIEQIWEKHIKIQFNFHRRSDRSIWGEVETEKRQALVEKFEHGKVLKYLWINKTILDAAIWSETLSTDFHTAGEAVWVRSRVAKSEKADFCVVAAISPELWRQSFLKLGKKEKKVNTLPMRMLRALGSRPYYSREVSTIKAMRKTNELNAQA